MTVAILKNSACETTVTTGTGTVSLAGAQPPFNTLRSRFASGDWVGYVIKLQITDNDGNVTSVEEEVGFGKLTHSSPDTLSRVHVSSSSNAGSLVNFSTGTKLVYCCAAADTAGWNLAGVEARTSAKTLNITHNGLILGLNATSGSITQNLPAGTDIFNGYTVTVIKTDSSLNTVTLDAASTDTIDGATTLVLRSQYDSVRVVWDGAAWLVVSNADHGRWITPAFNAGDFSATGGGSFVVASGDVLTYAYKNDRNTMTVSLAINTGTTSGTVNSIIIAIPAGKVATKTMENRLSLLQSAGTAYGAVIRVNAGGTVLQIIREDATPIPAGTDNLYLYGQLTFEIN